MITPPATSLVRIRKENGFVVGAGFLIDNEQHLPGGNHTDLQKRLQQAIRAAQVVVLALSPQTSSWQTVREHLRLADLYSRRLIQVWVSDDEPPAHRYSSSALQTAWVDTRTTPHEVVLQAIKSNLSQQRTITGLLDPFSVEDLPWEPRNPYKGLRAFREDDKDDFFGRDDLVSELLTDIEKMLAVEPSAENQGRFLTLIGPSGSGKSSVVMAGLLPQLKQGGKLTHSEQWVYLTPIVPGEHPLQALVNTLRPHLPDIEPEILQKKLETGSTLALHQLIIPLVKQWGTRVVLVVDQFEELFTQTRSQDEQRRFIELLQVAATEPGGPLLVLLTLRADFYHRLMEYPEFYQLVTPRMKPLLPLKVEALRKTIVQPALASDVQLIFEGTLIGDLLFEVQGQTGALPLLQFALEQLFERRNGHRITLRAYRDIEGVKGALKLHAEKTYSALPSETHRKLAQALFLRLIEPGNAEQETSRRRTDLTEFAFDDIHQTNLMQETIDALVNARLLTINGNKHAETVTSESNQKALISTRAKTTTIEVSHEALITEWPLLKSWVSEARKDLPLQHAIREDAADWEQNNRPADRLYRGTQLKEARAWATRNIASRQEQAFLRASATRRVRSVMMVLVVLLLVVASSGIAGWLALHQPPDPRYVTNADNDGVGSLRWAIANTPIGDTITFDPRLIGKAIVLKSADIHTGSKKLKIQGLGKERLVIGSKNNINVIIDPGASVIISDVAFKGSSLAIADEGGLTLTNSTVSGNSATGSGGGIYNVGTLSLTNSTVSGNSAASGGGIYNWRTLSLTNSTISGNSAVIEGGGMSISPETDPLYNLSAVVRFCTIYNNHGTAGFGDEGIWIDQSIEPTRVHIHASIVAGKPNDMTSVISGKFTSDDYNVIQNLAQAGFKPAPHDQSVSGSDLSKLFDVQEGLRKNGDPTATYKLFSSKENPAINVIPLDVCHVKDIFDKGRQEYIDQRGMPRPGGKKQRCDIGAYESSG